jgi:hypothetical protein
MAYTRPSTFRLENLAQVLSCWLNFVNGPDFVLLATLSMAADVNYARSLFATLASRRLLYRRGTVDLRVLITLDQLFFIYLFLKKQATLTRRSALLSLTPQSLFPDCIDGFTFAGMSLSLAISRS